MNCYRCATPLPDNARFCMTCGADVSGGSTGERTQPVEVDAELMAKLQEDIGSEYLIERELGRGGMAVVYLATDVHLGRKVAVKVLPPELTFSGGPHIVERFKREARTAATLDHPHIIPIHRVSTSGKLSWYVMKYLEGRTLADIIEHEAPLSPERTAGIIAQIAQGLEYAHRRSVVHRDIKPANIAIDAEGWVTVTDFGIAKALDTTSLTGSGSMIGTPYYMSPEQCAGREVSGASDQYSLAIVAYQMLSGHLPFTGEAVVDIIKKHCMDPPSSLAILQPNLTSRVVAVVERGLAKIPGQRFGSVKEFATAFAEAARHREPRAAARVVRPIAPRRVSETAAVQRAVEPVRQTARPRTPGPPRPPYARRSGVSVALGVAGTLALAGIMFGPLLTRPDSARLAEPRQGAGPATSPTQPPAARPDNLPSPRKAASAPAPPTAGRKGMVVLRDVLQGATVSLDGRRVRGSRILVQPDRLHVVRVEADGFEAWSHEVLVSAGRSVTITVQMRTSSQVSGLRPPTVAASTAAPPTSQPAQQPAPALTSAALSTAAPPTSQPAQQLVPLPSGVAHLTVGSRPKASISINGQPVPFNPVEDFAVPAGVVRLRFTVTDNTSTWSFDTTVTVAAGARRDLGTIPLVRRP